MGFKLFGRSPGGGELPITRQEDTVEQWPVLNDEQMREALLKPDFLPDYQNLSSLIRSAYEGSAEWHKWRDFSREKLKMSEFWTQEYIRAFGSYLAEKIRELHNTYGEITILEVGAGNGRLTHYLQQQLEAVVPGQFKIIATDSGKHGIKPDYPLECVDYQTAINKYNPQLVIVSWMQNGQDFTRDFRATPSVQEYILIGEPDTYLCGLEWETWGIDNPYAPTDKGQQPPYKEDGFTKKYHPELAQFQLSYLDIDEGPHRRSGTVSFEREKN